MSEEAVYMHQRLDYLESQMQTLIQGQQYIIQTLKQLTKTAGKQSIKPLPKTYRKEKSKCTIVNPYPARTKSD